MSDDVRCRCPGGCGHKPAKWTTAEHDLLTAEVDSKVVMTQGDPHAFCVNPGQLTETQRLLDLREQQLADCTRAMREVSNRLTDAAALMRVFDGNGSLRPGDTRWFKSLLNHLASTLDARLRDAEVAR